MKPAKVSIATVGRYDQHRYSFHVRKWRIRPIISQRWRLSSILLEHKLGAKPLPWWYRNEREVRKEKKTKEGSTGSRSFPSIQVYEWLVSNQFSIYGGFIPTQAGGMTSFSFFFCFFFIFFLLSSSSCPSSPYFLPFFLPLFIFLAPCSCATSILLLLFIFWLNSIDFCSRVKTSTATNPPPTTFGFYKTMLSIKTLFALLFSMRWDIQSASKSHLNHSLIQSPFLLYLNLLFHCCFVIPLCRTLCSINLRCISSLPPIYLLDLDNYPYDHTHHLSPINNISSLLHPSISEPIPIPAPTAEALRHGRGKWPTTTNSSSSATACPNISTTLLLRNPTGFQTLTVLTPAPCPTSIVTAFEPGCTAQVFPPGCVRPLCLLLSTTTEGCPGGCCPTKAPTRTTTVPCTTPCPRGCGTFLTTETVGCKSRG